MHNGLLNFGASTVHPGFEPKHASALFYPNSEGTVKPALEPTAAELIPITPVIASASAATPSAVDFAGPVPAAR